MKESDQPTMREVLGGWKIVATGRVEVGDKYWRPADRVWLPVISGSLKIGVSVKESDMPIIIRKEEKQ